MDAGADCYLGEILRTAGVHVECQQTSSRLQHALLIGVLYAGDASDINGTFEILPASLHLYLLYSNRHGCTNLDFAQVRDQAPSTSSELRTSSTSETRSQKFISDRTQNVDCRDLFFSSFLRWKTNLSWVSPGPQTSSAQPRKEERSKKSRRGGCEYSIALHWLASIAQYSALESSSVSYSNHAMLCLPAPTSAPPSRASPCDATGYNRYATRPKYLTLARYLISTRSRQCPSVCSAIDWKEDP